LDEALLIEAEAGLGSEALRFWELPTYAVVLGSGCSFDQDVCVTRSHADAVPIARRSSGGGTVLLGPGCLAYSLVLSYERAAALEGVRTSYGYILGKIGDAFRDRWPAIDARGTSDLAASGKKFSGSAQQRKRRHFLHHGTVLYAFDLAKVSHYLHEPSRRPTYRGDRDHGSFLMNLPLAQAELKQQILAAWDFALPACRETGRGEGHWPAEIVARLVREKYSKTEWLRRR
jgi:lipoate-protein ligase A